jgi:hypothetical protein
VAAYSIASHRARIEAGFTRASGVVDAQTQADLARYLCVLVAGFLEQATRHIYGEYARDKADPRVTRYVERQLAGFTNANAEKLCQLAGAFDAKWREELGTYLEGERKDAIDSVVANRHQIAHGQDVGITYIRIKDYFDHIKDAIDYLEALCGT